MRRRDHSWSQSHTSLADHTLTDDISVQPAFFLSFSLSHSGRSADTSTPSNRNKYACVGAVVIALIFVMSLGGGNDAAKDAHAVRSGQVSQHTKLDDLNIQEKDTNKKEDVVDDGKKDIPGANEIMTEKEAEDELEIAKAKFDAAETSKLEDIDADRLEKKIDWYSTWMGDQIRALLKDDDDFFEEDFVRMSDIGEERLNGLVLSDVQQKADDIKEEKTNELESDMDLITEGSDNEDAPAIGEEIDLKEEENKLIVKLKDEIDEAVTTEEDDMKEIAAGVAKDVVEEELKKKKGKTYVVTVSESNELESYKAKPAKGKGKGKDKPAKGTKATGKAPASAPTSPHHTPTHTKPSSPHHKPTTKHNSPAGSPTKHKLSH
mmetsp:Transcript_18068/g.51355  ORF Transcript_18068/g.51355 Transcript_18068/m.51355 type:complete len:377 (+) Transcript_18068:261-1391(+)